MTKHPVFRSLTDPILFLRVPYQYFLFLAFGTLIFIVLFSFVVVPLILSIILYIAGIIMTRRDPRWTQILTINIKYNLLHLSKEGKRYVA